MDLDTFFLSAERLRDRHLEGKPILIGGSSDRGVVAACSYGARKFGIHSVMPMKLATQLCTEAIIIKGSHADHSKFSMEVCEIIQENVVVFEKTSIDEFYADLTGRNGKNQLLEFRRRANGYFQSSVEGAVHFRLTFVY